jgi:hypothetical protein
MKTAMNAERLDIYLRAHTEKVVENPRKTSSKKEKELPDKWPKYALIVDTETRTDVHQRLIFGFYRVCNLVNGQYRVERERIVYSGAFGDVLPLDYSAVLVY